MPGGGRNELTANWAKLDGRLAVSLDRWVKKRL